MAMAFKLTEQAQKRWQKLNHSVLLAEVVQGVVFIDGKKAA